VHDILVQLEGRGAVVHEKVVKGAEFRVRNFDVPQIFYLVSFVDERGHGFPVFQAFLE
jgi:hypothetical protein